MYKASETGLLDQDELEAAKLMMTHDQYMQEFECSGMRMCQVLFMARSWRMLRLGVG